MVICKNGLRQVVQAQQEERSAADKAQQAGARKEEPGGSPTELNELSEFVLLSSFGQATNDSISLFSSNPIQSDTYKRLEVGDTVNLEDWFNALGITPALYKIIDGRIGTIDGDILTATNWGKTQVTVTGVQGAWRVIALEVRPKGAVAMPMVTTGDGNVYALKADGSVWGWGSNSRYALGQGSGTPGIQFSPIPVLAGDAGTGKYLTNIIEITSGGANGFALRADGTVWAWGRSEDANTGTGGLNNVPLPKRVTGSANAVHINTSLFGGYYINTSGQIYGWGANANGQTGSGSSSIHDDPPLLVQKITNAIDVRSNGTGTIALDYKGCVWQWGMYMGSTSTIAQGAYSSYNGYSRVPIMIPTNYLSKVVQVNISASNQNKMAIRMAIKEDGTLWRWGHSDYIGGADVTAATGFVGTPIQVNVTNVIGFSGTGVWNNTSNTVLIQHSDGTLEAWGYGANGEIGNGVFANAATPTHVSITKDVMQFSGSCYNFFMSVKEDGTVWSWGRNDTYGALGDSTTTNRAAPVRVGENNSLSIMHLRDAAGNGIPSTVTLAENETLTISAANSTKDISDGFRLIDLPTASLTGAVTFESTDKSIATVDTNGVIKPNYRKKYGETTIVVRDSDGAMCAIRVRVKPEDTVAMPQVSAGQARVTALKVNGTVWSWGRNTYGDAGNGVAASPNNYIDEPVQVILQDGSPLTDIVQIDAGASTTYALKADGTVWAWGDNTYNQIGLGGATNLTNVPYAVQVEAGEQDSSDGYLHNIVRIAAGQYSGYAITNTGEAMAWGNNTLGELGYGDRVSYGRPHYVSGANLYSAYFTNALDVSSQSGIAMFLRNNGTVFICGVSNLNFGNGTNNTNLPRQVYAGNTDSQSGYVENIVEIAATGYCDDCFNPAFYHLSADGEVYAHGYGGTNSLGLGDGKNYGQPQKVEGFGGEKVTHIAATGAYDEKIFGGAAITESGKTYTWGGTNNSRGQLGNGTFTALHPTPQPTTSKAFNLLTIDGARYAGYVGTMQDGTVRGWGGNWCAQLGYKTLEDKSEAVIVHGLYTGIEVNGAAVYRGSSAAAAYGADAGAAGTQCPLPIILLDDNIREMIK